MKRLLIFLFGFLLFQSVRAQDQKLVLKDTIDGQIDLSDYIVNLHGFVPFPIIISEPALGNFGVALGLVFIHPKKKVSREEGFHFPDITAVGGLYTANKTWGLGIFQQGSFPDIGMRYRVIGFYGDINLSFYREIQDLGEKEFLLNLQPVGILLDGSKNVFKNKIFLGSKYMLFKTQAGGANSDLPGVIFDPEDMESVVGSLGLYADWDNRNSIFTPDKGLRFKTSIDWSREAFGSDYNTERYTTFATWFSHFSPRWVSGMKAEVKAITDGAPFYLKPFIYMRGIPAMRYQGDQTLLFETEQRFDITSRWSAVGFLGSGRTYSNEESLKNDQWHWAGGAGFRYLLARAFNLRVGIDVATGPDQFAYYMVFGHYWNR